MDVYSKQGTKLETKENKVKMVPVPEKTFAEAMLEIMMAFVADEKSKRYQSKLILYLTAYLVD